MQHSQEKTSQKRLEQASSSLSIHFFGTPRFQRNGKEIEVGMTKGVALIAYLALKSFPQFREHLLGFLWAESEASAARKNLRNTLWTLRKVLDDEIILAHGDQLALNTTVIQVDVWEFERLADLRVLPLRTDNSAEQRSKNTIGENSHVLIEHLQNALALYHGTFLQDLFFSEAPVFETWMLAERERLAQLYIQTQMALLDAYRVTENWHAIIALAQKALAQDSLQESMYRALMEAHAHVGERIEALHTYTRLHTALARELSVAPLPETEALYTMILNGTIQKDRASSQPIYERTSSFRERTPMMGEAPLAPFIGREAERTVLTAELEKVQHGSLRVLLLTGEVGIGKSRLWHEWSKSLPSQMTLLETCCLEATQTLPFVPLIELLRQQHRLQRLLPASSSHIPSWLTDIVHLVPDLLDTLPTLSAPKGLPLEEERRRIFERLVLSIFSLAHHFTSPLILFIDDVHWIDTTTLDWLDYLLHRSHDAPLLLTVTYRLEDASSALLHHIAQWSRDYPLRHLPLQSLTQDESAALVNALKGNTGQISHTLNEGSGNPYFLIELSQVPLGDIPPSLANLVRTRMDALPDAARQVLQTAVVLEPEINFASLQHTSGRGEYELIDVLDVLIRASLLSEQMRDQNNRNGERYTFTHPLVATVVRADLSGARRRILHRRAAEAREAAYTENISSIAGLLATHYTEAGMFSRAAFYAEMAAERALTLGAFQEAVAFYQQALSLEISPARQLNLGRALHTQGNLADAWKRFEEARLVFEEQRNEEGVAQSCLDMADAFLSANRAEEVVYWAEQGFLSLNRLSENTDVRMLALAHFLLAAGQMRSGQTLLQAEEHLIQTIHMSVKHHLAEMEARSRFELGNLFSLRGDLAKARDAFQEVIALAHAAKTPFQEVLGYNNAAYCSLLLTDIQEARHNLEKGLALAEAQGLLLPRQWLYSTLGELALQEKQWEKAEEWFKRGIIEAEQSKNHMQTVNYQANLALVARGQGALESAVRQLENARQQIEQLHNPYLQTQIDLWLTETYAAQKKRSAATEALLRAEERLKNSEYKHLQTWAQQIRLIQEAHLSRLCNE